MHFTRSGSITDVCNGGANMKELHQLLHLIEANTAFLHFVNGRVTLFVPAQRQLFPRKLDEEGHGTFFSPSSTSSSTSSSSSSSSSSSASSGEFSCCFLKKKEERRGEKRREKERKGEKRREKERKGEREKEREGFGGKEREGERSIKYCTSPCNIPWENAIDLGYPNQSINQSINQSRSCPWINLVCQEISW
eukprot:Lithocolla_globosa_v1_NODE_4228_length_1483_cov_16.135854.p2 type:complete len:193 gc:universal NODE_4228_length_1483_cov_16.135854:145-723(+)